jgi:peptide/nickel transport system ATP-binding protein
MSALDIGELSVRYGRSAAAVEGFSGTVLPGEVVGVIGESGSGKSTVALSAIGLLPRTARADAAVFTIGSHTATKLSEAQFRHLRGSEVAMIFQEPMTALNPTMTVGAQVAEAVRLHEKGSRRAGWARAVELLRLVQLPDADRRAHDYPHQLSGGQRQRVLIAVAMAARPRILVADEPTTALDVTIQAEILDLLMELKATTGMGILFITHDLGVVARVCDRVIVMYRGAVVESGRTEDVLRAPQHEYTQALLSCIPRGSEPPRSRLRTVADPRPAAADPVEELADASPDVLLEFDGVGFRYNGRRDDVLHGVDLQVRAGRTLGIVGESGSGKSTVARLALAVHRPTTGKIRFRGSAVDERRKAELSAYRRHVQMVFQDPNGSFDPRLPLRVSLREPLTAFRDVSAAEAATRVSEALTAVGFDDSALDRVPAQFSGGQRQRLAIARALVTRPQLIVLDEPTSALDVSVQAQVLNLLVDLQRTLGIAYVFISHNLAVVRHMAHEIAVMQHGCVVEAGPALDVLEAPKHGYTRRLLASVPVLP